MNNNSNSSNKEDLKHCQIDSEGFKIPYMIEYDCSKLMINFIWVTVEQLVSCGEILNAIKCLESLIQFGEDEDFNNSRSHVLLGDDEMMEYEIRDKTIYNQEEEKKRAKKRYKKQGESLDILKYRLSSLEEAMSRIKLAELLFHYTHNLDDARFNLEKASLLLSADKQSRRSMELYCKLSFFLIEIFQDGGALNLAKQEIKKSLRYSRVLNSNEWMLYFLIKESYIILKDCSIVNTTPTTTTTTINSTTTTTTTNNNSNNLRLLSLSFKSLDTAILIVNQNLKGNPFLNVLLNTIKCHYSLMFFDYSKLDEMFEKCNTHLQQMNEQVLQYNQDATKVPEFFNYLMDGFKSTNLIIQFSRTNEIKIRDTILSYKQLKVYNNLVFIIYKIRIGSFKSIDSNILNLQIDLQELFNYLSLFNGVDNSGNGGGGSGTTTTADNLMGKKKDILPIPIFNFIYGPHYLSCICYLICAIHSRALGEMEKSLYCFDKSQQLIDGQLMFIYSSSNSNPTPQQMKESRALVRLKFIVYENLFYIKVTAMDLQGAFSEIVNCCDVYKCYPGLFTDGAESTIHYMSSLFQQSCGNYQLAKDHLSLAIKKCTRFDTQIQCIIALVFLNIYSGLQYKAQTLIQDYLSPLSKHPQLILRCTSLLLEGVILMSNINNAAANNNADGNDGDSNGNNLELAKNKFRECLLLSNNEIGHAQLTSNVLNQLAKLYISLFNQKTDSIPTQTEQSIRSMLDSSLSLGNILNDLNGKTCSLNILSKLNNNTNENDIKHEISKLLNTRNSIINNFNSSTKKNQFLLNLLKFGILYDENDK